MDPLFFELHSGLAHEAPGCPEDTLRALALTGLSGPLSILDAGCGPGAAAVTLLQALPGARLLAIDLHAPFLDAVTARAASAGVADRLGVAAADMAAPPGGPFDLIWSEGAAYSVGVPVALSAWAPLLRPAGRIVFSELIWTGAARPPEAAAFFAAEYPAMTDRAGVLDWIAAAGLTPRGDFLLSEQGWRSYYGPLAARAAALAARHGAAHPVLAETRAEIALRAAHADAYGYGFFVVGR